MIHATIDLYVKDRKDSEFPDSQTIAEMLVHDTLRTGDKDFLKESDKYFLHISVFNNNTHERGGAAYRVSDAALIGDILLW